MLTNLLLFLAAFLAGMINSVAGGGTLLTFPALVFVGLPAVIANATNNVVIVPSAIGGMIGYKSYLKKVSKLAWQLGGISFVGGLLGAFALLQTPEVLFRQLVPYLVLFSTVIFARQTFKSAFKKVEVKKVEILKSQKWWRYALIFQFLVSFYGGYFGAAIGIMMLANLAFLGMTDIHEMNALKAVLNLVIDGVAVIYFSWMDSIDWSVALVMTIGALAGGFLGGSLAQRVSQAIVRKIVIGIGFSASLLLFVKFN